MIRQARKEDAKQVIALMYEAIGSSIARSLTGMEDDGEAIAALERLYAEDGNRISWSNVIVDERDGRVAGMLLSYSGDEAAGLDKPLKRRILEQTGRHASIDPEAQPGDYYLDSIAVDPAFRGQGIAKSLIAAFEQEAKDRGYPLTSLIVEPDNGSAYALYARLGYRQDGELTVSGKRFFRMVKAAAGDRA